MFYNTRVTIFSQGEDRKLTAIYTDIKAQVYKKKLSGKIDSSIAENTPKEVMIVLIDADKINVRAGNLIRYNDLLGIPKELKAGDPEMIAALYFKKLIQIKCDLT